MMRRTILSGILVGIMTLFIGVADGLADNEKADNEEELRPDTGEVFMNVGDIVVRERKEATEHIDLPGSVDVMGWDEVKYENLDNALELLRKLPGVVIGDYGNGGVPNGFTLRGYDAGGHGKHTTVTIDGIPINSHLGSADGAPDLNQLTPEEVDRLELIKGPIDARYGNWCQAGILHLYTRTRGDFQKAKISYGSWNYKKAYASIGSEHADGKFNQVYSVESYATDGWREDADRQRQNAYAKWYYRPAEDLQIGLHVHAYNADWDTAGYLPESYWNDDPQQSIPTSEGDGGYKDLTEGSIHLDWKIQPEMALEVKAWAMEDTYARFADWGSGQTESYWENDTLGVLANLGWDLEPALDTFLSLDAGFDYRSFQSHGEKWNTTARHRESLATGDDNNGDFELNNFGLYAKANFDPLDFLRLFAGIRQDWFSGKMENWETGVQRDMIDYDATTYKGGVIFTPIENYSIYGNLGTTFALPSGTSKYDENAPDPRDYFFWEAGFKAQPWSWLMFRYAYFDYYEDGLSLVAGEWVSQGDIRRQGHELELNILPWDRVELFTAYTVYDAVYENGEYKGNDLNSIPEYIWKIGAQYTLYRTRTQIRAWYNDVGQWYTDDANDHTYQGYQVVDVKIVQPIGNAWALSFDIKNLTDEIYSEYVGYWSGENQYAGSNARSFYLALNYEF